MKFNALTKLNFVTKKHPWFGLNILLSMGVDPGGGGGDGVDISPPEFWQGGCYLKYPPQIFDRASLAF